MTTAKKRDYTAVAFKLIKAIFQFFRAGIALIASIGKNAMFLVIYAFQHLVDLLADPTMPSVVAIAFFSFCVAIAGVQWAAMGAWLFSLVGSSNLWGIAGGTFGLLFGVGINIYQLAPQFWRLNPAIARAYNDLNIDPDAELEAPTLKNKLANWLTYDHGTLKALRFTSYCVETGLVIVYMALAGQYTFWAICLAGASLFLPEKSLEAVAATTGVTRAVSNRMAQAQDDEDLMSKWGL